MMRRVSILFLASLLTACSPLTPMRRTTIPSPPVPPPAPAPVVGGFDAADSEDVRIRPRASVLDVWVLDAGQGACIYVACPDERSSLVIDCGTTKSGGASTAAIGAWINAKNQAMRDVTLLVSHGHKDHISHFRPGAIAAKYFDRVLLGGRQEDYPEAFLSWAGGARRSPAYFTPAEFKADDTRFTCGGAAVDLLTVNATDVPGQAMRESKENADSAIVRLRFAGHSIILPGDAESVSEASALANAAHAGLDLANTSLLVSSHHGAETGGSNSAAWLKSTQPRAGIFSANVDYATYTHPRCSTVQNFFARVQAVGKNFDLSCGDGRDPATVRLAKRLFNTYDNGHVRARFSADGVSYACQINTPACDAQLAPAEMP